MRFAIATSPSKPQRPNVDFAAAIASGAVLLDGSDASGTVSKCHHGVAWYARQLGGAIVARLVDEATSLRDVLAEAISATTALHADTCQPDDPGSPGATVIIVRAVADRFEYLVLADSVLVIESSTGDPFAVTDDREAQAGRPFRTALDGEPNGTQAHEDARRRYVEAVRHYRNQAGGFWVAADNPAAAGEAITGQLPLTEVRRVLLLSDGASRLVDRFGLATWRDLLDLADEHGPTDLLRRTRIAEAGDPLGTRWPRGKTHDDATAVLLTRMSGDRATG